MKKFLGFASDRIFSCDLDTPPGHSVLTWLTRGAEPGSLAATPLGATVEFVKEAGTLQGSLYPGFFCGRYGVSACDDSPLGRRRSASGVCVTPIRVTRDLEADRNSPG